MATLYVPEYRGYVQDVPKAWFRRCDGRVFFFDKLTASTSTPQINTVEINAGWSLK